jgi:hypothetical protein
MTIAYKPGDYCDECQNTGMVECYCGGDLCVCGQQEMDCPVCKGASAEDYDDDLYEYSGDGEKK